MKLAEGVLSAVIRDQEHREALLGDLREEHARQVRRAGAARAGRWHLRQSLGIAARYGTARLLRRKPPVRWIAMASDDADRSGWPLGIRDLRYAWRAVMQRPALSAVIVVTLAFGLAANSTTFSILDAIVLRPYRFPGIERLLVVTIAAPGDRLIDRENVSAADFREWREQVKTIDNWALYSWWDANLSGVDVPEQVAGFRVSPGYFSLLGARPILGRGFVDDEAQPGRDRRVVLGHALWTRRFAADPNIIGTAVRLDGEPFEVVGVAPPGFSVPDGAEVWAPAALTDQHWQNRRAGDYGVYAHLKGGESVERARAELTAIVETQRRDHPDTNANRIAIVEPFTKGMADPGAGPFLGIWQAAALLLLLIACANIANLLLARGAERAQEYALRLALGASRTRLFGQTLLEGLILAACGILLAMPLTWLGLALSRTAIPASVLRFIPGWAYLEVDLRLFTLTAILGTAAMLLFSLVPALHAVRAQVSDTLRQAGRTVTAGRRRQWLRSGLAATQVALALALLFASSMALSASDRVVNGQLGFDKHNVLVGQLTLPARTYSDAEKRRQFVTRVMDAMREIPAVTEVGFTSNIPAGFSNTGRQFWPEGVTLTEAEVRYANYRRSSSGYFPAMRIPLLQGRLFTEDDRLETTPVAVVSAGLVRRYWPEENPLGKRFKSAADGEWITVVGVVGDVVHNWFVQTADITFYRPFTQDVPYGVAFTLRTVGDPTSLAGDLRRAVALADPDQPIASLTSLASLVEERASGLTFIASALGIVSLIALVLSVMGVYSLMAFLTTQRTQEIGVRMALGAGRWQVVRLTTMQAMRITVAGTAIGAVLAFALGRLMQSLLSGLVTTNVALLAGLVVVLGGAALLAAYLPARRASHVDPIAALRES